MIVVFVHVWFSKMVELQELQGTSKALTEELQCLHAAYQKEVRRQEVQDGDAGSHEVVTRASVPSVNSPKMRNVPPSPLALAPPLQQVLLYSHAAHTVQQTKILPSWICTKQAYQW